MDNMRIKTEHLIWGAAALIFLLLVSNIWLMVKIHRIEERVFYLPTSFSSGSTYVNLDPLYTGVRFHEIKLISETLADHMDIAVDITLTEKLPGYAVKVMYREKDTQAWSNLDAHVLDALQYRAILKLDRTKVYEYQITQTNGAEIARTTHAMPLPVADLVGSPDLHISVEKIEDQFRVSFDQRRGNTVLKQWQIDKLTIRIDNTVDNTVNLYSGISFPARVWNSAKDVTVTVVYGDGVTRSLTFDPKQGNYHVLKREE